MSENTANSWDEIGNKLNGLGLKLKLHVEQASAEDHEITTALQNLTTSIEAAFEGLRNAAKDPGVKDDVRDVGASLSQAISKTFVEAGADIRDALGRKRD